VGSINTAFPTSLKQQLTQALHDFTATQTPTGNTTNGSPTVSLLSSQSNLKRGMPISGAGIPADTFIADLPTPSTLTLSQNATAPNTGVTLTCSGDTFNIALIKNGCAGTYGAASTGYADITDNSDEASGSGYTAGGQTLTNITPATVGTVAFWGWENTSWTGVTLDVEGCMIYNASNRGGPANNAVYVGYLGGEHTVANGTFTLIMQSPAPLMIFQ
jgi:hypothetical protein